MNAGENLNQFCLAALERMIHAQTRQDVKRLVEDACEDIVRLPGREQSASVFIQQMTVALNHISPLNLAPEEWRNVQTARVEFYRRNQELLASHPPGL